MPRIVVVGGGFAGLAFCKNIPHDKFQIVLIDKHNYHTFQPLLYQVATAGLEPDSIAYPLRKIFQKIPNFFFRMTNVLEISPEKGCIRTTIGELEYDHLVLATGTVTNFFGNESIEQKAMGMKFIPEALDIRSLILQNFEAALLTDDLKERESLMNIVIVGAGPTGVELAGAIGELRRHVLPTDYPDLDFRRMRIHLVEGIDRVLPSFSPRSSRKAQRYLENLDVNIWLNTIVEGYDGKLIRTNGKPMLTQTLIWAAGVKCAPIPGIPASELSRGGRLIVNRYNRIQGLENIYALGDLAYMVTPDFPNGHPQVAQPAIQQGRLLAKNFEAIRTGKEMKPFKYKDKGSLATIGRSRAVADLPGFSTQGAIAWFIWMLVHLMALVGFRNRIVVFLNWTNNFLSYNRDIRLIIRPYVRDYELAEQQIVPEREK